MNSTPQLWKPNSGSLEIDYRYLNMDTKSFCKDSDDFNNKRPRTGLLRVATNHQGQTLYSFSRNHYDPFDAIYLCRKISGLIDK
jgi:hypothetical protein